METLTAIKTNKQVLLEAILSNPEDDLSRLAYADLLEEEGDHDRSSFIRVQCELAKLFNEDTKWEECNEGSSQWCPVCGDCCCKNIEERMDDPDCPLHSPDSNHGRWHDLKQKEKDLLFANQSSNWFLWTEKIYPILPKDNYYSCAKFARGFVHEVKSNLSDWFTHGPAIVREHPIQVVRISDKNPTPILDPNEYEYRFWSARSTFPDTSELLPCYVLPTEIFVLLTDGEREWQEGHDPTSGARNYPSVQAALDDLSQACILWAKSTSLKPDELPR